MIGVVVLTQGRRPTELAAALESVAAQERVETDVVVVGKGWEPSGLPDAGLLEAIRTRWREVTR